MHIACNVFLLLSALPLVGIVAVAVTQLVTPRYNVSGNRRQQFYKISGGSLANYLDVGMTSILKVNIDADPQSNLTGYSVYAQTPVVGSSRIIFTTNGNFGPVNVEVIGN